MSIRLLLALALGLFFLPSAFSQEEAPADPPAAEQPAVPQEEPEVPAEPPAPEEPAEQPAPQANPADPQAKQEFEKLLAEWKELLKEMRKLKVKYQTAEGEETGKIEDQWNKLVEQGNALVPQLRTAGMEAYRADPNTDRELTRFLVTLLGDDVKRDQYQNAAELASLLIENKCEASGLYNLAGVAAFANHNFEKAEEYFEIAEKNGTLADQGVQFQSLISEYKDLWAKEQEIRKAEAQANDLPRVKLQTTKGDIVLELFENEAPETVGNFISLVESGFYDGLTFHRVLDGFVAQGGDPQGDGTGGPGYNIYCECYREDHRNHFTGSLSMAHAGRDTGGSQFFLTFTPTASLNGRHTVFGRILEGQEIAASLQRIDPSGRGPKAEPDKIIKAEVLRKREHEYAPKKVQ